jgi:hypothetical protein
MEAWYTWFKAVLSWIFSRVFVIGVIFAFACFLAEYFHTSLDRQLLIFILIHLILRRFKNG